MDQFLHAYDLIAVHHKVDHGFFLVGIAALGIQVGYTASENLTKPLLPLPRTVIT